MIHSMNRLFHLKCPLLTFFVVFGLSFPDDESTQPSQNTRTLSMKENKLVATLYMIVGGCLWWMKSREGGREPRG